MVLVNNAAITKKGIRATLSKTLGLITIIIGLIGISQSQQITNYSIEDVLKGDYIQTNEPKRHLATTSPSSKGSFDKGRCDLTTNSGDAYCGCDDDCNSDLKLKWEKTDFTCKYEGTDLNTVLDASKCYDRSVIATVADLQFGLRIYTNNLRAFLGILFTRESNPEDFISENFDTSTSTKFETALKDAEDDFSTPLIATTTAVPTLYSIGTDLYLSSGSKFKMPLPNTFGLCEEVISVKFLEDVNATSGTRYSDLDNCDTNFVAEDYTGLTFFTKTGSTVSVTPGTIWVVDENDQSVSTTTATFQNTNKVESGTNCLCSNVLKEIHYTAYTNDGSEITSIVADVVYMTLDEDDGTTIRRIEQIYSFTFKESRYSRVQSGSPGYTKGHPVLAGAVSATTTNFILANENGFQLYGADDSGDCIIDTSSVNPTALYYANPVLNFVDNAIYGGKLSKTVTELQTFCTGTDYQNIALFKNLINNLEYVGIYGNSNPHFISDWVAVEYESTSATTATFSSRTGAFDAAYKLVFYLTKLGTEDNPQLKISRVILTPVRLAWVHDLPAATSNKEFHAYLSISFQEVPQSKSEFVPKPPNKLPKMSRNVLYPFFIFDGGITTTVSLITTVLVLLYFIFE